MSTTTFRHAAITTLDPRDMATISAALMLYQARRAELLRWSNAGVVPTDFDEALSVATAGGAYAPLSHEEVSELRDLIDTADTMQMTTTEPGETDVGLPGAGIAMHELAREMAQPDQHPEDWPLHQVPVVLTVAAPEGHAAATAMQVLALAAEEDMEERLQSYRLAGAI